MNQQQTGWPVHLLQRSVLRKQLTADCCDWAIRIEHYRETYFLKIFALLQHFESHFRGFRWTPVDMFRHPVFRHPVLVGNLVHCLRACWLGSSSAVQARFTCYKNAALVTRPAHILKVFPDVVLAREPLTECDWSLSWSFLLFFPLLKSTRLPSLSLKMYIGPVILCRRQINTSWTLIIIRPRPGDPAGGEQGLACDAMVNRSWSTAIVMSFL